MIGMMGFPMLIQSSGLQQPGGLPTNRGEQQADAGALFGQLLAGLAQTNDGEGALTLTKLEETIADIDTNLDEEEQKVIAMLMALLASLFQGKPMVLPKDAEGNVELKALQQMIDDVLQAPVDGEELNLLASTVREKVSTLDVAQKKRLFEQIAKTVASMNTETTEAEEGLLSVAAKNKNQAAEIASSLKTTVGQTEQTKDQVRPTVQFMRPVTADAQEPQIAMRVETNRNGAPSSSHFAQQLERILQSAQYTNTGATKRMFIRLHPDSLGAIRIEVIQTD
ncbi:MAG: hypothetical protein ACRC5C_03320, partial [Bacilli bacterium]